MGFLEVNDQMCVETDPCVVHENTNSQPSRKFAPTKTVVAVGGIVLLLGCAIGLSYSYSSEPVTTDSFAMDNFYEILSTERAKLHSLNYSAAGYAKEDLEKVRQLLHVHKEGYMYHETAQLKTANCAIDITHSIFFLERAALAITAATASCKPGKSATVQAACAADISAVYAAVAFVAEYISAAVASCSENIHVDASCSAAISGIVANTARIATSASFIAGNCKAGGAAYGPALDDSVWQMTRRLRADAAEASRRLDANVAGDVNAIEPTYDESGMAMTSCVLDATQAATYLADFGIAIDGATKSCNKKNLPHGLKSWVRYPVVHQMSKIYCAANLFNIFEALFAAAAFISTAVSQCAPATNQDALCAGGANGVVAGTTGLLKSIMFTYGMCDKAQAVKGKAQTDVHDAAVAVQAWNNQPKLVKKSEKFAAKKFLKKFFKKAKNVAEDAKEDVALAKEHPVKAAEDASRFTAKAAKKHGGTGGSTTVVHHTR